MLERLLRVNLLLTNALEDLNMNEFIEFTQAVEEANEELDTIIQELNVLHNKHFYIGD